MEQIITLSVGQLGTNCYLIKQDSDVLIIDPGASARKIEDNILENESVNAIILTHGHFDHIGAVDSLVKKFKCPVYIHSLDERLASDGSIDRYNDPIVVSTKMKYLKEGKQKIGAFEIEVYHTPGHTDGSVCIKYYNSLFTGDTVFKGTVGRTDLYSGSNQKMFSSIQFIKTLDPNLTIYPGHGKKSILEEEINSNPYF